MLTYQIPTTIEVVTNNETMWIREMKLKNRNIILRKSRFPITKENVDVYTILELFSNIDMRKYLEQRDVWVRILEHLDYDGMPISSTRIRACISEGKIKDANEMLGYNFTFESKVISGDHRGRTIGFPTINQHLPEGLIVPKFGVYESRAFVDGKEYKSFTNIGIRPTWRVDEPLCETHIFDFNGDLYGKTVRVELVDYKREEKIFSSVEELKEQLNYDKSSIV